MNKKIIKDKTGVYMEIPRDKIKFVSKEAEIIFDLSTENDYLQQKNNALKEKFIATNKGLQKVLLRSKKWKHRYELAKHEIKELKTQNEFLMKRDNKCQILEQQYCERTDCSGRLGTSKKVEALEKENEKLKNILEQMGVEPNEILYLKEQNQELKKQLHEASLTIQEMVEQNIWCPSSCDKLEKLLKENKELKKQLENNSKINVVDHKYASKCEDKVIELEVQQKKFIKYLEDESKEIYRDGGLRQNIFRQILQKYKEIVNGVDKE